MGVARPHDLPAAFARAWMDRDAAALAGLFAQDADFVNVVGIWWEDRAAIERAHAYALGSFFAQTRLSVGRIKTRMLGDQAAVVQCRFHLAGQLGPDGAQAAARSTILVFVLEKAASGWVAVAAQNTDIVPGAETQLNDGGLKPADYR